MNLNNFKKFIYKINYTFFLFALIIVFLDTFCHLGFIAQPALVLITVSVIYMIVESLLFLWDNMPYFVYYRLRKDIKKKINRKYGKNKKIKNNS